uniref:Uncharacterized protein n=1 Tax=Octactis speculum TaxID=3111310 RepID=A0A6U3WA62_9STRA|mmetsp:Transcript_49814/g.67792  ORF Transcript_49814/g.67792 Transcript_49814/m.67792 type:complete len:288 (+) Transcript_49814:61-924(+)
MVFLRTREENRGRNPNLRPSRKSSLVSRNAVAITERDRENNDSSAQGAKKRRVIRRVSMLPGDSPQDGAGSDTAQSLTEGAEAQGSNFTGEAPLPQRVHLQESTRLGESNRDDENSRVVAADDAEPGDNARAHVDATGQGGLLAEHHESGDDTQAHVDAAAAVGADEELRRPEDGTLAHVDNADDAENEVEDNHDDERGAVDPNGWEEDLVGEDGGDISEDGGAHELNDEDAVMRRGREIEEVVARRRAKNKMSVAAFRMICGEVRGKIRHTFFSRTVFLPLKVSKR